MKRFYHFSDELTHNFAFTYSVVEHLIHLDPELEIIRIKFLELELLEKGIPVICYGVSGHGKGLVDAMSSFGAKGLLRNAVVTQDLHYGCESNIVSFLKDLFINDNQKHHFELASKEIQSITTSAINMIVFFPNGSIQVKQNICSCNSCIRGGLIDCCFERDVQVNLREINSSG